MLHNLFNFPNIIKNKNIRKKLENQDLIGYGAYDPSFEGNYKPVAILAEDLVKDVANKIPEIITISEFTELIDTPANYTGAAGQIPVVNGTETGLVFSVAPTGTLLSTTVNISSAQILSMGTSPITLLSVVPHANKYIKVHRIMTRSVINGPYTAYTQPVGNTKYYIGNGTNGVFFNSGIFEQGVNPGDPILSVTNLWGQYVGPSTYWGGDVPINDVMYKIAGLGFDNIILTTDTGTNPTLGNSDAIVTIIYELFN